MPKVGFIKKQRLIILICLQQRTTHLSKVFLQNCGTQFKYKGCMLKFNLNFNSFLLTFNTGSLL